MSIVTFNYPPVKANISFHPPKKESENVRVVEHKITAVELERLKQKIGVKRQHRNYNQIINGYGTGLHPPTENEWNRIAKQIHIVEKIEWSNPTTSSPSYMDHTKSSWFPPIGNQNGEGSCTTWTVGYYMKTFQEAKEHGWNLSAAAWEGGYKGHPTPAFQDKIFSPDFIYHQINDGGDNGSYFSDAINLVCSIGACTWEKMPYNPDDSTSWPSEEAWRQAPLYCGNNTGIEYLNLETDSEINYLKNWISSNHLAAIAVDAYQYGQLTTSDVWTLDNYLDPNVNHANTVVGYNDDLEYTEEGVTRYGAFRIANSWGIGGWEKINDGCYWISYETMKQRIGYCMFYRDRIGYDPKLVASFKMEHSKRGECNITFGIGNKSAPIQTKRFDDWVFNGGNHPFCSNNIVLDITEFRDTVPTVINQSFFMEVYDEGSLTTGTIDSFSTEYYHNYTTRNLYAKSTSYDVPVNTTNQDSVFAELILETPWIVDDDGPADFHTIQEAIDAASSGDTVFVKAGTYNENITINKALTVTGENRDEVIITRDVELEMAIVDILAEDVTFSGFTVLGTRPHLLSTVGINVCPHATIVNNKIISHAYYAVHSNGHSYFSNNIIANNSEGIYPSGYDVVAHNEFYNNFDGIWSKYILNNTTIIDNKFYNNSAGIHVDFKAFGENNSIVRNVFAHNKEAIRCALWPEQGPFHATIYHNDFINNSVGIYDSPPPSLVCRWDDDYPSGGNYWSNYKDVDLYSGPHQNETGSDGIWDHPYIIDADNKDNYPLTKPYGGTHDIGITNVTISKTVIGQGYNQNITIKTLNYGINTETFNITVYANTTIINQKQITLTSRNSTILNIPWNTTDVVRGNYTITAEATPLPYETDTLDNTLTDGWVYVSYPGDVNGDGKVNVEDMFAIAKAFGSECDQPKYKPNLDINGDCKINVKDMFTTAKNFGKEDP
jgi:hypothetical protein